MKKEAETDTKSTTAATTTAAPATKATLSALFAAAFFFHVQNLAKEEEAPPPEDPQEEAAPAVKSAPVVQANRISPPPRPNRPDPRAARPSPGNRQRRPAHPRESRMRVDPAKELMITDLRVVEDPVRTDPAQGELAPWTFKHLMENMAGANDPSDFTLKWLQEWETDQEINGNTSPARPAIRQAVIDPWLAASGGEKLDLALAPFKLLAIVNRLDLRVHDPESVTTAGEGRFVFGVLNEEGLPLPPVAGPAPGGYVVIFEYELVAESMQDLSRWARQWHELGKFRKGSTQYNATLENITRRFTDSGMAPNKPNGNSINQIRTNEFSFGPNWELREFVLDSDTGLLRQHTVAQTPDTLSLNGTANLAALINDHETDLLEGNFSLPPELNGPASVTGPFLPTDFGDFEERIFTTIPLFGDFIDIPWSAEGILDNEARHTFALNTCNGCHRHETDTGFLQVGFPKKHNLPESLGKPARLAGFLTGINAPDPVFPEGEPRKFNDLERRAKDLKELLEQIQYEGQTRPPRKSHRPKFIH
jgi:hypothetical protein